MQTSAAYNSRTAEYRRDFAELVALHKSHGLGEADRLCREIIESRDLAPHEALTLADGFRRAVILGA